MDINTPLLEVSDFTLELATERGKFCPVESLSFSVEKGKTLAIVGESGCGKSLTALSLLKLFPKNIGKIKKGSLKFEGKDLVPLPETEMQKIRGKDISMIFQEPMTSLNPVFSVGFQIQESLEVHFPQLGKKDRKEQTIQMLKKVGIGDAEKRYNSYPHELSGGMRQRIMIAMALIAKPKLLVADEPTTALDVTIQAQVLELMKDLQKEMGMAIILITHDLGIVSEFSDNVLVMYAGKAVEKAPTETIFKTPLHPYTQGLIHSLPSFQRGKDRLEGIPGQVLNLFELPGGCRFYPRCKKRVDRCTQAEPILIEEALQHSAACFEV